MIHIIFEIESHLITNLSLIIMKNGENCHSRILWFTQMVKREITLTLNRFTLSIDNPDYRP